MRLFIKLNVNNLSLPIHYNHYQQALIYNWINDEYYQSFLHDVGFKADKSTFKMFTFSKFFGNYNYNQDTKMITFTDKVWFTLSSPNDKFLEYIIDKILFTKKYLLNRQEVQVEDIKYSKFSPSKGLEVETKSPITAHVSLKDNDKTKTRYLSPADIEFNEIIRSNLIRKFKAFYGCEPQDDNFTIKPSDGHLKMTISNYKGFIIKGWEGKFYTNGSPELLKIGYDAGLGARNSMGFGLVEKIRNFR